MALSNPRSIFGIHSAALYRPATGARGQFYGILKVLGSSNLNLSGDLVSLNGGSSPWAWAVEGGLISAELELVFREYPNFIFEVFLGKAPTANAAEASGSVTAITGDIVDATTGIASVGVKSGSEADVKFAKYWVIAVTGTTVDVYASSDIDFARGTDLTYQNDALKITASPLTVPNGTVVEIPGTGLELTGGSAVAMTIGETGIFGSRPINTGSMDVVIGAATDSYPNFGALLVAQKDGDGRMFEIDLFKCKQVGAPIGFSANEFSEASVTAQAFQDVSRGGVFAIQTVLAS